jgi:hypothetical protein
MNDFQWGETIQLHRLMNLQISLIKVVPYDRKRPKNHGLRSNHSSQRCQHKHKPINPTPRPPRNTIIKRIGNPFRMILQRRRLSQIRQNQTRINNTRKRPLYSLTIIMSEVREKSFYARDGEENTT